MNCQHCHKHIAADARFCSYCATPVVSSAAPVTGATVQLDAATPSAQAAPSSAPSAQPAQPAMPYFGRPQLPSPRRSQPGWLPIAIIILLLVTVGPSMFHILGMGLRFFFPFLVIMFVLRMFRGGRSGRGRGSRGRGPWNF